jgi:hypothetical protein
VNLRRCHVLLAKLLAVVALLFGLAGSASAAFNHAAENPHYGEKLLRQAEVSGSAWLQPADPVRGNGEWVYDSASGVPAYVRQNPWSAFDPEGLFEWSKVGQSLLNTASGIGELGQDAGSSINEILWLGAAGFEANGRFNQKLANIGTGLVESGGKAIDAAHLAAGGDLSAAGEKALTILGNTPEEVVANGIIAVATAGIGKYVKGGSKLDDGAVASGLEGATQREVVEAANGKVSPGELVSRQGPSEMTGSKVKRLTKDMKENGFDPNQPVEYATVDGRKIIVDGHHRTEAAKNAGIKEIPATEKQVSPEAASKLYDDAAEAAQERASRQR